MCDTFYLVPVETVKTLEIIVSSLKGGTGLTYSIFCGEAYFQDSGGLFHVIVPFCVFLHGFIGTTQCGIGKFPQVLLYLVSSHYGEVVTLMKKAIKK